MITRDGRSGRRRSPRPRARQRTARSDGQTCSIVGAVSDDLVVDRELGCAGPEQSGVDADEEGCVEHDVCGKGLGVEQVERSADPQSSHHRHDETQAQQADLSGQLVDRRPERDRLLSGQRCNASRQAASSRTRADCSR